MTPRPPKLYPCHAATCFCVDTAPTPSPGEHPLIPDLKIPLLSLPAFYSGILKGTERKCMHACVHMKNASVPVLSLSWMSLVQEDLVSGDYLWSLFSISKNEKKSDYLFFRQKKNLCCNGLFWLRCMQYKEWMTTYCQHTSTAGADLAVFSPVTYSPEIQECLVTYREGNKKPNLIGISRILIGHSAKCLKVYTLSDSDHWPVVLLHSDTCTVMLWVHIATRGSYETYALSFSAFSPPVCALRATVHGASLCHHLSPSLWSFCEQLTDSCARLCACALCVSVFQ